MIFAGWEYAVEAGLGTWVPYERNVHLSRRRRWVRLRLRDKDSKISEKKRVSENRMGGCENELIEEGICAWVGKRVNEKRFLFPA